MAEFIQRTIDEIIEGVWYASNKAPARGAAVAVQNRSCPIEFDVAVASSETGESNKGGGIKVVGLNSGAAGKTATESRSESRIKFTVHIMLPHSKLEEK